MWGFAGILPMVNIHDVLYHETAYLSDKRGETCNVGGLQSRIQRKHSGRIKAGGFELKDSSILVGAMRDIARSCN